MHPRNRFKEQKPDFEAYAKVHQSLGQHLVKRKRPSIDGFTHTMDFSDPDALRELTCACLKYEFNLDLSIPSDRLIPTVPQRLNYIHWIEDLLCNKNGEIPKGTDVIGIDIGTGATCIYPLLGVRLNGWKFLATEADETSLKFAEINVKQNKLDDNISVKLVSPDDAILMGVVKDAVCYDFCMCNPPFFKDKDEKVGLNSSRSGHRPIPQTHNTGNEAETITEGGELKFVERIISDSLKLKTKIRWYSSMVGKKSSIKALKTILKQSDVPVVVTTEFCQGRTHRWGIAWSFNEQLTHKVVNASTSIKRSRPLSVVLKGFTPTEEGVSSAFERIKNILDELQITHEDIKPGLRLKCSATTNTWSHQRKRKRIKQRLTELQEKKESYSQSPPDNITTATNNIPTANIDNTNTTSTNINTTTAEELTEDDKRHYAAEKGLLLQLESLSVPCSVTFSCSVDLSNCIDNDITKKVKRQDHEEKRDAPRGESSTVVLSLELLEANDHDVLQQILQYIQNCIKLQ